MTSEKVPLSDQLRACDEHSAQLAIEKLDIAESSSERVTVETQSDKCLQSHSEELAVEKAKQIPSIELKDALRKLYGRENMTLEFAYEIRSHAETLSVSLCTAFSHLKAIMERHEPLIRRRWSSKTRSERQALLLDVLPTMATTHRPDLKFSCDEWLAFENDTPSLADQIMFPYINLEDLCKPQPLLIFLNARAFNLPWTFVNTEDEFSPSAGTPVCLGRDGELGKMEFHFTKNPEPGKYGEVVIIEDEELNTLKLDKEELLYVCQRQGLQKLYLQERIYTFLLSCSQAILHDMSEDSLKNAPIAEAHLLDISSGEHGGIQSTEHKLFSDTILLAPYRARSCVDFHRLRSYFDGFFSSAKDHVWALREDPSYLADAIKEIANHRPELIKDPKGRVHWRVGRPQFMSLVMKDVVIDAYMELGLWKSLFESTDKLCQLTAEDKIEVEDIHDLYHRVKGLHFRAEILLQRLLCYILTRAPGSPGLRHLYTRYEGRHGLHDTCRHKMSIGRNATEDCLAFAIMQLLEGLQKLDAAKHANERMLFDILDILDIVMNYDLESRAMISSLLAREITKLSIAAECLRQIAMWMSTPEIRMVARSHADKCNGEQYDDGYDSFRTLPLTFWEYQPLVSVANPNQGCLTYPVHHYPNRRNVEQMRKAEQNLDRFWSHVDSWFKEETSQEQHDYIMPIIMRKVCRTPPWIEMHPVTKLDDVYVPIPEHLHETSKQITGVLDRSSQAKKTKTKTHGLTKEVQVASENTPNIPEQPALACASEEPETRHIDKRTFKTLKTIFGTNSYSEGEVSKTVKWDAFVRAMIRTGFAAEKLQGSAWQFTPHGNTVVERSIQFHEPHPDSDIPYGMARRFGRRLERVYGWTRDTFRLA